ncbi:MAG: hypothetical protein ACRDJW_02020 [Thermomicrobiales bacterium]
MVLPRVTGILHTSSRTRAVVTVRCPECGKIHRHDLGPLDDPEVIEALQRRWVDEWMACRLDLPGNYYRIVLRSSQVKVALPPKAAASPESGESTPSAPSSDAPRRRRRRKRKRDAGKVPSPAPAPNA